MTVTEMKARLREINVLAKNAEADKLDALMTEAEDLNAKIKEAENRAKLAALAGGLTEPSGAEPTGESGNGNEDEGAKRGKALIAGGKVNKKFNVKNQLSSTQTVLPTHTAQDVNPAFNEVSSLVDRVRVIQLPGGESYQRGFVKGYGEGDYTNESAEYAAAEPTFGYAVMAKTKITAYCEEPEEIAKLAPAAYDGVIEDSTEVAIKKKLSRQILVGDGEEGHICGIFHNPSSSDKDIIDRNTDLAIEAIDDKTLDEIIYSFGGNEDVEDAAVLILNKADLKAFAMLRDTNGNRVYNIVNHGNTGTINTVPYLINSACKAVSAEGTSNDEYCMAYGPLSNYEMPVFSDLEIQRSTEYKFKQGQIAHKGVIFAGGNVASYNGFLRVKKKAE